MAKKREIASIQVLLPWGQLQVQEATTFIEDGEESEKKYHRYVLEPGDLADDKANATISAKELKLLKDIAALVWTPDVLSAWGKFKEDTEKEMESKK